MEQGTNEWLQWRKSGLGGSDAPIIMNVSKWKKPYELFLEKTAQAIKEQSSNYAIERGHELEPIARAKFASIYNLLHDKEEVFDQKLFVCQELPFMRVSLDGISSDGKVIIEIKFMGKEAHKTVAKGEVPNHYYPQLQWELFVSGAEILYFVSINDDKEILYTTVERNEEYMALLIHRASKFWSCVERNFWDFEEDHSELFEKRFKLAKQIEELEEQKKEVEKELLLLAEGKDMNSGMYYVKWVTKKGNVKYSDIPELVGVDLDKYRGEPVIYPKFGMVKK